MGFPHCSADEDSVFWRKLLPSLMLASAWRIMNLPGSKNARACIYLPKRFFFSFYPVKLSLFSDYLK